MLVQLDFLQRPYKEGRRGDGGGSGREESYLLPNPYNQDVTSGNKDIKYRGLLHAARVLCNSWCGSHCARLGSLQAVDDAALANIRQT